MSAHVAPACFLHHRVPATPRISRSPLKEEKLKHHHASTVFAIFTALALPACSSSTSNGGTRQPAPEPSPATAPAPWTGAQLRVTDVPQEYLTAWNDADNRERCALVAFDPDAVGNAKPRIAMFSGGWAVAFDRPDERSAFGVAGTGVNASEPAFADWPHRIDWADGSSAEYGLEGGAGPNHLAYVRIAGQGCLYNVWSALGREHLERLLGSLRRVDTDF